MRKPAERVIYNNYSLEEMWDDCRSFLIENGNENPSDDEVWEEINFSDACNWEEEKERLEAFFDGDYIAVGTCGRWDGNHAGGFLFNTLSELLERFSDCDYIKMWDENGHFFMTGTHHDGTHFVEIKKVTERGKSYYENWNWSGYEDKRTEKDVHAKMFSDSHYTNLMNYMHKCYDCPKIQYK